MNTTKIKSKRPAFRSHYRFNSMKTVDAVSTDFDTKIRASSTNHSNSKQIKGRIVDFPTVNEKCPQSYPLTDVVTGLAAALPIAHRRQECDGNLSSKSEWACQRGMSTINEEKNEKRKTCLRTQDPMLVPNAFEWIVYSGMTRQTR